MTFITFFFSLVTYYFILAISQVPFESAAKQVLEQLKLIAKGEYKAPSTEKRNFGTIVFAAVSLPVTEIQSLLVEVS